MSLKYCIVLLVLVTLFAAQKTEAQLLNPIVGIINGIIQTLKDIINRALENVANILISITSRGSEFLLNGGTIINTTITQTLQFITTITNNATAQSVNITDCIGDTEARLTNLLSSLTLDLATCINNITTTVTASVNSEKNIIDGILDDVSNFAALLSQCLNVIFPFGCLPGLLTQATSSSVQLPGRVVAAVEEAVSLLGAITSDLGKCVSEISATVTNQTAGIISSITECVDPRLPCISPPCLPISGQSSEDGVLNKVNYLIAFLNKMIQIEVPVVLTGLKYFINIVGKNGKENIEYGTKLLTQSSGILAGYLLNVTTVSGALDYNLTLCLSGREFQVNNLTTDFIGKITTCITSVVDQATAEFNSDVERVNEVVRNVSALPGQLSDCLLNSDKEKCLGQMAADLLPKTNSLPIYLNNIATNGTSLVDNASLLLVDCVADINTKEVAQFNTLKTEVNSCIDDVLNPPKL